MRDVARQRIENTKKLAIVNFPVRDTNRMQSFFQVAQQTDRNLVINLKQAFLLRLFENSGVDTPRIDDEHMRVYVPRKAWGVFGG